MDSDVSVKIGTASGTLISMIPNVFSEDVARTILLAILGAVVSFVCTVLLDKCSKLRKK